MLAGMPTGYARSRAGTKRARMNRMKSMKPPASVTAVPIWMSRARFRRKLESRALIDRVRWTSPQMKNAFRYRKKRVYSGPLAGAQPQ